MIHASFGPAADLYSELSRLHNVFDQAFSLPARSSIRALSGATFPVINVGTTPDAVEVMALAPGLEAQSLQITVDRGLLVIAGERQSPLPEPQNGVSVYARERFDGSFKRVVSLPDEADPNQVQATYRDGILRISVAKRESSRPRRIEVN